MPCSRMIFNRMTASNLNDTQHNNIRLNEKDQRMNDTEHYDIQQNYLQQND